MIAAAALGWTRSSSALPGVHELLVLHQHTPDEARQRAMHALDAEAAASRLRRVGKRAGVVARRAPGMGRAPEPVVGLQGLGSRWLRRWLAS